MVRAGSGITFSSSLFLQLPGDRGALVLGPHWGAEQSAAVPGRCRLPPKPPVSQGLSGCLLFRRALGAAAFSALPCLGFRRIGFSYALKASREAAETNPELGVLSLAQPLSPAGGRSPCTPGRAGTAPRPCRAGRARARCLGWRAPEQPRDRPPAWARAGPASARSRCATDGSGSPEQWEVGSWVCGERATAR